MVDCAELSQVRNGSTPAGCWPGSDGRLILVKMTVFVQILSAPTCQECDITVETLRHLTAEYPVITVERLNTADRPEILERHGLLSFEYSVLDTHAVVIDDKLAGVGHPAEDGLRHWLDRALIDAGFFDEWIGTADPPGD